MKFFLSSALSALFLLSLSACSRRVQFIPSSGEVKQGTQFNLVIPPAPLLANSCVALQINLADAQNAFFIPKQVIPFQFISDKQIYFYENDADCGLDSSRVAALAKDYTLSSQSPVATVYVRASESFALRLIPKLALNSISEKIDSILIAQGSTQASPSSARPVGYWSAEANWRHVLVGDFDGDGVDDVAGLTDGRWWVARSTSSNQQTRVWGEWSTTAVWSHVSVGDFNGDGKADLAGFTSGQWWVSLSTGSSFVNVLWATYDTAQIPQHVLIGDFDGNGRKDIAAYRNGEWWVAASVGQSSQLRKWTTWNNAVTWNFMLKGDFDGDGKDDIAGFTGATWWVGFSSLVNSQRVFDLRGGYYLNTGYAQAPKFAKAGDFDGDGITDILTMHNGNWFVTRTLSGDVTNLALGVWPEMPTQQIFIHDFNGDGLSDIMAFETNRWYVGVLHKEANALSLKPVSYGNWSVHTIWRFPLVGNFSSDEKADVMALSFNSWWLGQSQL